MTKRAKLEEGWESISTGELEALRAVIAHTHKGRNGRRICDDAGIHDHDLKNFLRNKGSKPKWRLGVRLLAFASRQSGSDDSEIKENFEIVAKTARKIFEFDADDDYFFKHLEKLGVTTLKECKSVAKRIHGRYYMYRLGSDVGLVVRSHIEISDFDPFDKLPHFINRLKFGPLGADKLPMRKAEGQVLSINNTYIFVAFVLDNFGRPVTGYKGFKLIIVPSTNFDSFSTDPTCGMFASFSYGKGNSYEYGPALLVRTDDEFDEKKIGQFKLEELGQIESRISSLDLEMNIREQVVENRLAACLAFLLS